MPGHDDLSLILDAAKSAGKIAARHWHNGAESWEKPGGAGPLTEADLEVDAFLLAHLQEARPSYGWLSEETTDNDARRGKKAVFIVDPIDGTRSFANGEKTWAISIAVVVDGAPVAGVVHMPLRDKTYTALHGQGAFLNGQPISAAATPRAEGGKILAARPTLSHHHWPGDLPPMARYFRSSLAYRLCLVAEGRFDAMATFRPTWEWDIAAGCLIATEAGAIVSDGQGGPISFNRLPPQAKGTLVATPKVHSALLKLRKTA
ncbi:MAG: 3'(2'),5'-bisphosphate nucleotidase CysQ [Mangrovicoccus sp.]